MFMTQYLSSLEVTINDTMNFSQLQRRDQTATLDK